MSRSHRAATPRVSARGHRAETRKSVPRGKPSDKQKQEYQRKAKWPPIMSVARRHETSRIGPPKPTNRQGAMSPAARPWLAPRRRASRCPAAHLRGYSDKRRPFSRRHGSVLRKMQLEMWRTDRRGRATGVVCGRAMGAFPAPRCRCATPGASTMIWKGDTPSNTRRPRGRPMDYADRIFTSGKAQTRRAICPCRS